MPGRDGASCAATRVDVERLTGGAPSHRHRCEVLRRACFFNGTVVPAQGGPAAAAAAAIAATLKVRNILGSHETSPLSKLHPLRPLDPESTAIAAIEHELRLSGFSACVPLVWLPVWAFSFADTFVSSIVPLHELLSAGLIDKHVLLRPDLWAWPRSKNPAYQMAAALSAEPVRSVREVAGKCDGGGRLLVGGERAHGCVTRCYNRLLVCQFKSTFDTCAATRHRRAAAAAATVSLPADAAFRHAQVWRADAAVGGRTGGGGRCALDRDGRATATAAARAVVAASRDARLEGAAARHPVPRRLGVVRS